MLSETELQLYWTNAQVLHDHRYPDAIRNTAASALKNIAEGVPRLHGVVVRDLRIEIERLKPQVERQA